MTYYFDMDGVIANFHKETYKYENAINRTWIANLEAFEENVKVVRELIAQKKRVYILTKAASEEARLGKIDWLAKHIPEITEEKFICIVGNGRKVDYIKEDGILVDDDMRNLKQWAKEGHATYFVEEKGQTVVL